MKNLQFGKSLERTIAESLKGQAYRRSFRTYRARAEIAAAVKTMRETSGLTRGRLAARAGMRSSAIARLESVDQARLPSLAQLMRVFSALDGRASLRIVSGRRGRHEIPLA